ncbi:RfbX Membrane protein involved in the export of O-antigen and teichoic acid [Rhabdaerophilaceae bacterium]
MLMSAAFLLSALAQFGLGLLVAALLGPAQFGLYALGFAAAVVGQTVLFEWIRLSITRFSGAAYASTAALRTPFIIGVLACLGVGGLLVTFGGEQRTLYVLIALGAASLGYAECRAAHMRAGFAERSYALLLLMRVATSLVLVPAVSIVIPRGDAALAAFFASILIALGIHQLVLREASIWLDSPANDVEPTALKPFLAYALPIVGTNLAYLLLFLGLRLYVASSSGLAQSGQFSLALDIGLKLVMTLGTALDLYLFQLAVRARDREGRLAASQRLGDNLALIIASLAPMVLGVWLVLPSLETLLIAPAYRGIFATQITLLLPSLLIYALVQYGLHPLHQLGVGTRPLILAACLALLTTAIVTALGGDVGLDADQRPAFGLLLGMALAALLLWWKAESRPSLGGLRFFSSLGLALSALFLVGFGLRQAIEPGAVAIIATGLFGGLTYAICAWLTDLAGLKMLVATIRRKISQLT